MNYSHSVWIFRHSGWQLIKVHGTKPILHLFGRRLWVIYIIKWKVVWYSFILQSLRNNAFYSKSYLVTDGKDFRFMLSLFTWLNYHHLPFLLTKAKSGVDYKIFYRPLITFNSQSQTIGSFSNIGWLISCGDSFALFVEIRNYLFPRIACYIELNLGEPKNKKIAFDWGGAHFTYYWVPALFSSSVHLVIIHR